MSKSSFIYLVSIVITRFTSDPEVVGDADLEGAVAVGVLEEPAALDAIDVAPAVEVVAWREAHRPFRREVQSRGDLPLDACAEWQAQGDAAVLSAMVHHAQTGSHEGNHPAGAPVVAPCAVSPEVVLIPEDTFRERVVELIRFFYRVPGVRFAAGAFDLSHSQVEAYG